MPRKKLIYTHLYPYHIIARSNNREWFRLSMQETWKLFISVLNQASIRFNLQVHAFVLMNNHYHLIASTSPKFDLGYVMCWVQTSVSRKINQKTNRINHVFGSRYKASLITSTAYFANVFKYVYQNPVRANICQSPFQYPFSSLNNNDCISTCLINGIYSYIPASESEFISWLKTNENEDTNYSITNGLMNTVFKPVHTRRY